MSFQCQSAVKTLLVGNCFSTKNVVWTSHSTTKLLLSQCKGYSHCTNVINVSPALKTLKWQATTRSFLLPSSVVMSTKSYAQINRANVLASPTRTYNTNITSSAVIASTNHELIPRMSRQKGNLLHSIHTSTSLSNINLKTYPNPDNSCSTKHLNQLPAPTTPKHCSSWGLHSNLLRYNIGGQQCGGARRGLHSSPRCRDIYIIESEEEFEKKVMDSKLPVVINFHAEWCEPCQALKPLLEGLAEKYQGRMHLAEVKVDDHVALLHAFEVTAVPAVLGVVKGQVTEKFVGLISETELTCLCEIDKTTV